MFEIRVQLCKDINKQPVEDASVEWNENEAIFRTVATLTIPPQDSYSLARYGDQLVRLFVCLFVVVGWLLAALLAEPNDDLTHYVTVATITIPQDL